DYTSSKPASSTHQKTLCDQSRHKRPNPARSAPCDLVPHRDRLLKPPARKTFFLPKSLYEALPCFTKLYHALPSFTDALPKRYPSHPKRRKPPRSRQFKPCKRQVSPTNHRGLSARHPIHHRKMSKTCGRSWLRLLTCNINTYPESYVKQKKHMAR